MFLMGCHQPPLSASHQIVGIPQESLWELGSTLSDLVNSALVGGGGENETEPMEKQSLIKTIEKHPPHPALV